MSAGIMPFDIVEFFSKKKEYARFLRRNEVIPSRLEAAFDLLGQLDPDWVWVVEVNGEIEGVLVASPAHGVAMIWRVVISPKCSRMALAKLLRQFLRDCRKRGLRGYLTVLSLERENEKRLASIMEHSGAKVLPDKLVMIASPMPRENI